MTFNVPSKGTRLGRTEQEVFRMFIHQRHLTGKVTFNVLLKPSVVQHSVFTDPLEQFYYTQLRSKRIDAVMETQSEVWLLEVKEVVRPNAIGQLLVYKPMYLSQYRPLKPVKLGIIAGMDDIDTSNVANSIGISVFITHFNPRDHRFDDLIKRRRHL